MVDKRAVRIGMGLCVAAVVLYALLPLRLQLSNMVWSESLYLFLLVTGLWLWLIETERSSLIRACDTSASGMARTRGA